MDSRTPDTPAVLPGPAQSASDPTSTSGSGAAPSVPTVVVVPPANDPPVVDKATNLKDTAIDNIGVALGLVKDLGDLVEKVPFIAPAAAVLSAFVKTYKVCLHH